MRTAQLFSRITAFCTSLAFNLPIKFSQLPCFILLQVLTGNEVKGHGPENS